MNYKIVETNKDIKDIEMIASVVWPITYKKILTPTQIKYMLDKFLSEQSIKENIEQDYTYIIFSDEDETKNGFAAYKKTDDKIFLSKLYILPNSQNQGITSNFIKYLKNFNLPIELTVNKANKNAYEKYLHLGFKVTQAVKTDIGQNFFMDDYVMVLK